MFCTKLIEEIIQIVTGIFPVKPYPNIAVGRIIHDDKTSPVYRLDVFTPEPVSMLDLESLMKALDPASLEVSAWLESAGMAANNMVRIRLTWKA